MTDTVVGDTRIYCHEMEKQMKFAVARCTRFTKQGTAEWEYEKIAWILKFDAGKPIGFVRPGTVEHKKMTEE